MPPTSVPGSAGSVLFPELDAWHASAAGLEGDGEKQGKDSGPGKAPGEQDRDWDEVQRDGFLLGYGRL